MLDTPETIPTLVEVGKIVEQVTRISNRGDQALLNRNKAKTVVSNTMGVIL